MQFNGLPKLKRVRGDSRVESNRRQARVFDVGLSSPLEEDDLRRGETMMRQSGGVQVN